MNAYSGRHGVSKILFFWFGFSDSFKALLQIHKYILIKWMIYGLSTLAWSKYFSINGGIKMSGLDVGDSS